MDLMVGYQQVKKFEDMFSHFNKIHGHDRQMDNSIGHSVHNIACLIVSYTENEHKLINYCICISYLIETFF